MKKNKSSKKIILILIGICFILGLLCVGFIVKDFWAKDVNGIKKFTYSFSDGWTMSGHSSYEITCSDKCIGNFNLGGKEYKQVTIDEEKMDELVKIINENNVPAWNGFDQRMDVTDGSSFTLEIKTNKNDTIKAHGYMKYPRKYKEFKKEVVELFKNFNDDDIAIKDIDYVDKFEVQKHTSFDNGEFTKFSIKSEKEAQVFNELTGAEIDFSKVDFKDEYVFIEYVVATSGSDTYVLDGVLAKNGKLEFDIEEHMPDSYGTNDMAYWYIGAIINFEDVMDYNIGEWKSPLLLVKDK